MTDGAQPGDEPRPGDIADRAQLATALTGLRERAGLSVRELSRRINVPVGTVGGYLSGRHLPGRAQTATLAAILRTCGVADDDLPGWLDAVRRIRQAPGPRPADRRPPYPGLASFQPEDAGFFFGRTDVTDAVVGLIAHTETVDHGCGLVAVVGPSGSGKSSVLRAGVIPAVHRQGGAALLLSPGEHPVHALATALADHLGLASDAVAALLRADIPALAEQLVGSGPVVLVVDQAEELFTVCTDPQQRRDFLDAVHRLVAVPGLQGRRCVVGVLGLRGDFYTAAAREPVLLPALRDAQVLVGPMSRDELAEAITGPAAAVGVHIEDGLLQMLLDDLAPRDAPGVAHDQGALPLLAHALRETWQVSRRGRMTVADYVATGGIAGAVERTAEAVWADLDDSGQDLARRILLRLVYVDEDATVTRRRVRARELRGLETAQASQPSSSTTGHADGSTETEVADPTATGDAVSGILDRFVRARLLTARRGWVEISHEILLVAWSRMHEWVDADRAGLRTHRQLTEAARAWEDGDRDPAYLLRGGRLETVREWLTANDVALNRSEQDFVDAGVRQRTEYEAAERRHRRRLRQALVAVAVLAVIASGLAVFGLRASQAANERADEAATARDQAQSRELSIAADRLRANDPALAAQLSLIGFQTSRTVDARSALLDSTASPAPSRIPAQGGPTSVALDPARPVLAVTGAQDGSVHLWSVRDPRGASPIATMPPAAQGQPFSVAIAPDGSQLATGNENGLIQRWTIRDPAHPVTESGPGTTFPSGVLSLVYSPDGTVLAAGGAGGAVQRWDVSNPQRARPLPTLPASSIVGAVAYSPDGSMLWAGGDDGVLRAWSVTPDTSGARISADPITLQAGTSQINTIAVSPDGRMVAAGDQAGQVALWRRDGASHWQRQDLPVEGLAGWVSTVAFSPDGSLLAIGTTGNQVQVLATDDWSTVMTAPHPGPVTSLVFDGNATVIVAATDGYVRVWPVPGPTIGPVGTAVFGMAAVGDHRLFVATASAVNRLLSFGVADPQHPAPGPSAAPGDDKVQLDGALGATLDGRLVGVGSANGRVQLWDTSDPTHPVALGPSLHVSDDVVQAVGFSADGRTMAAGGNGQRVRLWDVSDPRDPRELASTGNTGGLVYGVAFQPTGTLLAAATTAGTVVLWDIADRQHPRKVTELGGMEGYAMTAAFSPDGTVLAAAGAGRTVHLWDVTDPQRPRALGDPLTGPTNRINMIAFNSDGSRLAAAASDGVVWLWNVQDPTAATPWAHLHSGSGILYSLAFSPDGSTLAAAGSAQQVWRWTMDPRSAERQVCRTQGTGITEEEWTLYVQDRPYRQPCRPQRSGH